MTAMLPCFNTLRLPFMRRLEDKVHTTKPHAVSQQRNNTRCEISSVSSIQRSFRICTEFIRLGRRYFRHLLWHWRVSVSLYNSLQEFLVPPLSPNLVYDITLGESRASACRSNWQTKTLYYDPCVWFWFQLNALFRNVCKLSISSRITRILTKRSFPSEVLQFHDTHLSVISFYFVNKTRPSLCRCSLTQNVKQHCVRFSCT